MKKKLVWILVGFVLLVGAGAAAFPHIKAYAKVRLLSVLTEHDKNITAQTHRIACDQTARFVMEHMRMVPAFTQRFEVMDHSLRAVDPKRDGLYCEFGVFKGESINYIASKIDRTIHGFDSFEGLPEDWRPGYPKGKFDVSVLPKVRQNVRLHKGWFNESLPVWAKKNPGPILFIHFDADLYSSTKTVLDILGDRIVPGTVLLFDEYFNYPGWQLGEYKAFKEFVESRDVKFEYLAYRRGRMSGFRSHSQCRVVKRKMSSVTGVAPRGAGFSRLAECLTTQLSFKTLARRSMKSQSTATVGEHVRVDVQT